MKSRLLVISLGGVMALLVNPASVEAQAVDPQILLVPYAPNAPLLPHPAHGEARITLKGMLRNAGCAQGYRVRWDTNRNGRFDDDTERTVTPSGGSVYDIGRTFTVPRVANDSSTPVNLRVVVPPSLKVRGPASLVLSLDRPKVSQDPIGPLSADSVDIWVLSWKDFLQVILKILMRMLLWAPQHVLAVTLSFVIILRT